MRSRWAEWFTGHDLLLCPVMTVPAFPHDHSGDLPSRRVVVNGEERALADTIQWLGLVGVVGLPSAVVPVGRVAGGPAGLPVGMQIVAPFLQDRRAVRAAELVDDVLGAFTHPALTHSELP